jgi:Ca2+-transporting ATPase
MMQEVEERKKPLQLSIDEVAEKLSAISFAVIAVICLIGLWQKRSWFEMFTVGGQLVPFLNEFGLFQFCANISFIR